MKLAVLVSFSGAGGVERMMLNLIDALSKLLENLDLITIRTEGPHFHALPANVNHICLKANHSLSAVPEIAAYLKQHKPDAMLVAKDRAGRAAILARSLAGTNTPIVLRLGTNLSTALKHRSAFGAWWRTRPMRRLYAKFDKIVAVSHGVAEDTRKIAQLPPEAVVVIRNPVITEAFEEQAAQAVEHPWFADEGPPIILGIGRLSIQKDFETLIRAFHSLNKKRESRLIILGEGKQRSELTHLISDLGLSHCVSLVGFQANPLAWLKRASLFVLSSRWEGSPNALTESLGLGVPCVSTRCPSGPDELLAGGKYGPLVEVGNVSAMAHAMEQVLARPLPPQFLKQAVVEYRAATSANAYLSLLRDTVCVG